MGSSKSALNVCQGCDLPPALKSTSTSSIGCWLLSLSVHPPKGGGGTLISITSVTCYPAFSSISATSARRVSGSNTSSTRCFSSLLNCMLAAIVSASLLGSSMGTLAAIVS